MPKPKKTPPAPVSAVAKPGRTASNNRKKRPQQEELKERERRVDLNVIMSKKKTCNHIVDDRIQLIDEDTPPTTTTTTSSDSGDAVSGSQSTLPATISPCKATDKDFAEMCHSIENAIEMEIFPERIAKGSSGSYFVKDERGQIVAVFKPKNEEPYGKLNPKWVKWMHRHCLPCCFGRSCLVPNQGYMSEVGASIVDESLDLNIVPKTRIVQLASPTFFYSRIDRNNARTRKFLSENIPSIGKRFARLGLPLKVGSLQQFVQGYRESQCWLTEAMLDEDVREELTFDFQKMVVLDFIIRNTDRSPDNWLIKYERGSVKSNTVSSSTTSSTESSDVESSKRSCVALAAIDHGLAFPFKHPDQVRTYPYSWASLKIATIPFTEDLRNLVLPKVQELQFTENLCNELSVLFRLDKGFDRNVFERQMSVMRGQIRNLEVAIRDGLSPADLVTLNPLIIERLNEDGSRYNIREQEKMPCWNCC